MPERAFADFVALEGVSLRRLALLLEDDRADADELTRGVLVGVRSRWARLGRREDPLREARRMLVRRVLARRPSDGPRTSGWVDDPDAGWDAVPGDDLRRALSALPAPTRVAVVLSVWAGLPEPEIADLLRAPEDTVRGEVVAGLAPLRAALAPVVASWHVGVRLPDDAEVRAQLDALAEDGLFPVDPAEAAADVERQVRSRRRRRWPVAVAAAAAAVVLAVPAVTGREAPRATDGTKAAPEIEISALPTRGPLADDQQWLDGLLMQPWDSDAFGDFPVEVTTREGTRQVLWAGDVPAGRWALVIGEPDVVRESDDTVDFGFGPDDQAYAWFTGPVGAAPEDMRLSSFPNTLVPDRSPGLLDAETGTLVVVGLPGDAVEVSERVELNADGSDSRTWTPATVEDGVSVVAMQPVSQTWPWAVNYRVSRGDDVLLPSQPEGIYTGDPVFDLPDLDIDYRGAEPDATGRRAAGWAAFIALSSLGPPTDDTDVTARVVRRLPGGEGSVALVTITLPSGAYLVSAQWAWTDEEQFPGGNSCGLDVRPARPAPDERLLVAGCDIRDPLDGTVLDSVLVGTLPPRVATLRLYRADGTYLAEKEVTGRTVVLDLPPGTQSVEAVTAGGVSLGRSDLLGQWQPSTD